MNRMENEKQKKKYTITSKGVESQVFDLSLETGDGIGLFKISNLAESIEFEPYTKSLESEVGYIKNIFPSWSSASEIETKDFRIGKTQSGLEVDIKDNTINNLSELLKNKEKIIKKIRLEISEKNKKIDDLQTTQKLKLEKTIQENTLEIRSLKETIQKYQEIIRPPSLTQEVIDKYMSRFIAEDID